MPIYGFNLGKDATLALDLPTGPLYLGYVEDWDVEEASEIRTIYPVSEGGEGVGRNVHKGWNISATISRQNGVLDRLAQILQDAYLNGLPQIYATFTETIKNQDGTIDIFVYSNSVITVPKHGHFVTDAEIQQTIHAWCPRRWQG